MPLTRGTQTFKLLTALAAVYSIASFTRAEAGSDPANSSDNHYMHLIKQASELINTRHIDRALALINQAIEEQPRYFLGYAVRGKAEIALGRWTEAGADLDKAIALNPQYCSTYNLKMTVQEHFGHFDQDKKVLIQAAKICPNALFIKLHSGRMLCATGKYAAAIEALSAVLQEYPSNAQSIVPRALAEAAVSKYDSALWDLERQSKLARVSLRLTINPVSAIDDSKLYEIVEHDIDLRIKREGLTTRNQFARAVCKYTQGKYSDCAADAKALTKSAANLPAVWILYAYARLALKDPVGAKACIEQALSLAPAYELGYSALCNLNFHMDQYAKSIDDLRIEAQERSRKCGTTHRARPGVCRAESGRRVNLRAD